MTSPSVLASRFCKLEECGKPFQPVTSWQEFHCPACRNRYSWLERKKGLQLIRETQEKL